MKRLISRRWEDLAWDLLTERFRNTEGNLSGTIIMDAADVHDLAERLEAAYSQWAKERGHAG